MTQTLAHLIKDYAAEVQISPATVQAANHQAQAPLLIVLDDDPTGTQSVADLPVLMSWEITDFIWAMSTKKPAIYVMTNSRSLSPDIAEKVNREVATNAYAAAQKLGIEKISFVSRSDSTLRGHFPLEPYTLAEAIKMESGQDIDGILVVPAFPEAGRITVASVHYARQGKNSYLPVAKTEFAKDASFGYQNSHLAKWIAEKTQDTVSAKDVIVIDLDTLRSNHNESVARLRSAKNRQPIICDIITENDLRLLALALNQAESAGSKFLYRVGPPFVRARIGQDIHPPLNPAEIAKTKDSAALPGGLIVIGSHVALTTNQLNYLREKQEFAEYEIEVEKVLNPALRESHLREIVDKSLAAAAQQNVVIRTSRKLIKGDDADSSLAISRQISAAVVTVVQGFLVQARPKFLIAKGGITSSDVAAKGLGIRQATVIGPLLEGIVSLWLGENEPARGIPYIVFAGNVGDETSLNTVVAKLSQK